MIFNTPTNASDVRAIYTCYFCERCGKYKGFSKVQCFKCVSMIDWIMNCALWILDMLLRERRHVKLIHISKNEGLLKQRTSNTIVTHQDSNSKWNKIYRECTVDKDSVVNVSLINVACGGRINKLTLLWCVHMMHRYTLPQKSFTLETSANSTN